MRASAVLSESFGKGVVVNLQFGDLGVLVSSDCRESGLWEGEGLEMSPADCVEAVCLDHMEPGLIAVQRVHDDLIIKERAKNSMRHNA